MQEKIDLLCKFQGERSLEELLKELILIKLQKE